VQLDMFPAQVLHVVKHDPLGIGFVILIVETEGPSTVSPVGVVIITVNGPIVPVGGFVIVPTSIMTFPEIGSAPVMPGNPFIVTTVFPLESM